MANDFGDIGGDWTADWRELSLLMTEIQQLAVDTAIRTLKHHTLNADREENRRHLGDLQRAVSNLERQAERYKLKAAKLHKEVATFRAAIHTYMSTWQPPEAPASEWSVNVNPLDDEAIDRIARFYRDSGRDIR